MEDDCGKAIARRLVTYKMTCYHLFDEKTVFIFSLCFAHVPSLQSAICTSSLTVLPDLICNLLSLIEWLNGNVIYDEPSKLGKNIVTS